MKIIPLKSVIVLLTLLFGINLSTYAQVDELPVLEAETQPLMLIENKITFYAQQIDFASIKVESMKEETAGTLLPIFIIASDNSTITLDFSACETGDYLISGTRNELVLHYSIQHKK